MLKELFVLRSGTPLFYYSQKEQDDLEEDQSLLSSGLLSAISSFSEEARSSQLDSFSSENEIFVFQKIPEFEANLVGAFTIGTPSELANLILNNLKNELLSANVLEKSPRTIDMNTPTKSEFRKKVPKIIAAVTNTSEQKDYFDRLVNQIPGIFLSFIYAINSQELVYKFARPRPLFREEIVNDVKLITKVSENMIQKLNLGHRAYQITMERNDKRVSIIDNEISLILIASNLASLTNLEKQTMRLAFSNYRQFHDPTFGDTDDIASYKMVNRQLSHISGEEFLTENANIFLMTVLNNAEKLFHKLFQSQPERIYFSINVGKSDIRLQVERQNDSEYEIIKIK